MDEDETYDEDEFNEWLDSLLELPEEDDDDLDEFDLSEEDEYE